MNQTYQQYVSEWDPSFRARSPEYSQGPVRDRPCRDICCLITFFVIVLSFLFTGFHYIKQGSKISKGGLLQTVPGILRNGRHAADNISNLPELSFHPGQVFASIILMTVLSFGASFAYIWLLKAYPRCMIYFSVGIGFTLIVIVGFIALLAKHYALAIGMLILLLVYGLILCCCFRGNFERTILLLRLTSQFLTENLCVLMTPVSVGLIGFFLSIFAVASIQGVSRLSAAKVISDDTASGISVLHLFYYFFFVFFLYYAMVYLIASAAGDWYFNRQSAGCCTGVGRLTGSHIGSITFASIIISLVKILQAFIDAAARDVDNLCSACCLCLVKCFVSMLEGLIQTLNHFAIIVMSYTGEQFIDSAKTAGVVIFSNAGLFVVLDSVNAFIFFTGLLFTTLVPTLISIPLVKAFGIAHDVTAVALLVFLVSLLVSCIFLCSLTEALMSIYVFYCFDRRLQTYGVRPVPLVQHPLSQEQLLIGDLYQYPPAQVLSSAYPLLSGTEQTEVIVPPPAPAPTSNIYQPAAPAPIAPLYQPYNSQIKPNYDSRGYNDPSKFTRNSKPSNLGYPEF